MSPTNDHGQLHHRPTGAPVAAAPTPTGKDPRRSSDRLLVVGIVMLTLSITFLVVALVVTRGRHSDDTAVSATDDAVSSTTTVDQDEVSTDEAESSDDRSTGGSETTLAIAPDLEELPEPAPEPLPTAPLAPPPTAAPPPPPAPTPRYATVVRSCGSTGRGDCFVSVRSGPTSSTTELTRLYEGSSIQVVCTVQGSSAKSSILGRSTNVWAKDTLGRYISMAFLDVPGWDIYTTTVPC